MSAMLTCHVRATTTPYAQRNTVLCGVRVRYVDEGSGPPLIIVPGLTARIEDYDALVAELRGNFRVLVLDFPGSGYSDKPNRPYTVEGYVDALLWFLDALGITRCHLVGGSLGGNIVLRAALRAPQRFERVVAWGVGSAWNAKPFLARLMRLARFVAGRLLFWPVVFVQSRFWFRPGTDHGSALRDTFAYYTEVLCPGFVRMYWGLAADQIGNSLFPFVRWLSRPALLLRGEHDHALSMKDGMARLHALIPGSRLVVVPGAGHALASECPAALAAIITAFLHDASK